jgi:hypothetical protein
MSETSPVSPESYLASLDTSAIWTVRYIDPSGFECQLSLEGSSGSEVLKKAQAAIERLKESQCSSIHRSTPMTKTKEDSKEDEILCPLHGIKMKRWSKGDRSWYSHRWQGGWCKGGVA